MTRQDRRLFLCLAIAITLAMGTSIRNGFVYDDVPIIVNNPLVTDPAHWAKIFQSTYWPGAIWRPLTVAGFALQWYLGHGAPWLFHTVSLALYLLLAWCAFRLLREIGAPLAAAAAAVLAFVVHPLHVEVVANVVGQAELLAATSMVVATWAYLHARRRGFTLPRLLTVLAAIAIGTMAKEQGFVAPAMLLGAEWLLVPERGESWRSRIRLLLPATAFTMLMLVVRSTVAGSLSGGYTTTALVGLDLRDRLVTFIATVPEYARLLVWPLHLQAEYAPPHLPIAGPITARHVVGIALVLLMVGTFLRCRRRLPLVAFGLWWAAVAIGPVSSVFTVVGIVMAERVFFIPTVGFALALAGTLAWLGEHAPHLWRLATATVMALWVTGATLRSAVRVPVWHDQDRFFNQLTIDGRNDYRAWRIAGNYWLAAGHRTRGEENLREALRLWPHDAGTNETLGQLLRGQARCLEAIPILRQGLTVEPDRTAVRAKLLECLISLHDTSAALAVAEAGIALGDSSFVPARSRLLASPVPR